MGASRVARRRGLLGAGAAIVALAAAELLSGGSGSANRPAPGLPSAVLVPPRESVSSLRGKPAAVNFWASWCGPCRHEAPELERLARSLSGQARLVGVDWSDGLAGARSFLRRYGWSFPVLRDSSGRAGERYGVAGLPTTFILDPRGRIVRTLRGPQTEASLRSALRAAADGLEQVRGSPG
jgi:cytochrome c biogenesis protein CcmG, thiol:disulfide interchange protein DsbE